MVEIFKTDVRKPVQAKSLVSFLRQHLPGSKINVDLDDCDKVLRVEGLNFQVEKIIVLVREKGFECKVLDD
jgi:hypothetical protein